MENKGCFIVLFEQHLPFTKQFLFNFNDIQKVVTEKEKSEWVEVYKEISPFITLFLIYKINSGIKNFYLFVIFFRGWEEGETEREKH